MSDHNVSRNGGSDVSYGYDAEISESQIRYSEEEGEEEDEEEEEEEEEYEYEYEREIDEAQESEVNRRQLIKSYMQPLRKLESSGLIDIGNLALWTLSSYKASCGLNELRDDNPETYWQSDGAQPHSASVHFNKKVHVKQVSVFTSYYLDESYTPSKITVLAGNGEHDLKEVKTVEMNEPSGWIDIDFKNSSKIGLLKTFFIRILIVANHQNGKDTHIRALKIFSPISDNSSVDLSDQKLQNIPLSAGERKSSANVVLKVIPFTSVNFISRSKIR